MTFVRTAAVEVALEQLWKIFHNEDGLESAKPDLQSMFKKPGDKLADRRLRVAVRDERAK
jgi:hypothetical protein